MTKMYIDKKLINQCKGRYQLVRNPKSSDAEFQLIEKGKELHPTAFASYEERFMVNGKKHVTPFIDGSGFETIKDSITLCLGKKLWKKWDSLSTYKEDVTDGSRTLQVTRSKDIGPNDPEVQEIIKGCISYEAFLDAVLGRDWVYPVNKVMDPV